MQHNNNGLERVCSKAQGAINHNLGSARKFLNKWHQYDIIMEKEVLLPPELLNGEKKALALEADCLFCPNKESSGY